MAGRMTPLTVLRDNATVQKKGSRMQSNSIEYGNRSCSASLSSRGEDSSAAPTPSARIPNPIAAPPVRSAREAADDCRTWPPILPAKTRSSEAKTAGTAEPGLRTLSETAMCGRAAFSDCETLRFNQYPPKEKPLIGSESSKTSANRSASPTIVTTRLHGVSTLFCNPHTLHDRRNPRDEYTNAMESVQATKSGSSSPGKSARHEERPDHALNARYTTKPETFPFSSSITPPKIAPAGLSEATTMSPV